ncbi:aspartic proteinase CDR1-like [Vicia villosa]|uniref:aspartic proteinase CDR1-like n=1 Tax=Vicia villosa TaxID=3911 RepID=UPI00273BFD24|nr:aspartic proteinase CDR1-like [Vicia villosa]
MEGYSCSNDGDTCEYIMDYGRGTKTKGYLCMDTLTLDFTSGSVVSFSKIIIGCGHTNTMTFEGQSSGIISLGPGNMSMVNQLGSLIDGKFSYCLVVNDYYRKFSLSSKLNFGHVAVVSGDNVVSTPFDKKQHSYFLSLKAFSVGNKRIKFEGFKGVNSSYNILLDSSTPLTLLPKDYYYYYRLESTVIKAVELERFQDPAGSYRLCYNTTSSQHLKFPEITAHFIGADVKLDVSSAFELLYKGIQCFAFFPFKNGFGIFGNAAQVNYLVGYDLKKNIVSFKPTNCFSDNLRVVALLSGFSDKLAATEHSVFETDFSSLLILCCFGDDVLLHYRFHCFGLKDQKWSRLLVGFNSSLDCARDVYLN